MVTSFEDDSQGPQVFENVWDAIEDDPAIRQRMKILSSLMLEIALLIRRRRWTQVTAAKRLGVTQPRVSNLLRGKIHLFSIDALVEMAGRAGLRVEITFKSES
ncbi:MAG TPA: XRE family transcriptional regulator [Devosia sp.]|jgi:predicted XRE-type DNA-binding protein|nr:XRE family transcriptional regulator [Devosia sp.]